MCCDPSLKIDLTRAELLGAIHPEVQFNSVLFK